MFTETETLRVRLHQLRLAGHSLADLLQVNADRLDANGEPLLGSVLDQLQGYREQFSHLTSLFDSEYGGRAPSGFQFLSDLESELEQRDTAKQATTVARSILQIIHRDRQSFPALDELQSAASELVASLGMKVPREEILRFTESRHVWCDLLRMISEGHSLPDAEWTRLNTSVEASLGRSLAVAAARGRLEFTKSVELAAQDGSNSDQLSDSTLAFLPAPQPVLAPTLIPDTVIETQAAGVVDATDSGLLGPLDVVSPAAEVEAPTLRWGLRNSAVVRAVTKARSESTKWHPKLSVSPESVSDAVAPEVARINESLSLAPPVSYLIDESPSVALSAADRTVTERTVESQSVFDDIEPVSLNDNFSKPSTVAAAEVPPRRPASRGFQPSRPRASTSSIFDDDADDENEKTMDREMGRTGADLPLTLPAAAAASPSPLAERLLAQARFADATGPSASLATMILNGPESDRADLIPDLILHLVHDGRPGLAYHLSRSLEARATHLRPFVPSWLIRTWAYGHALVFPKGQLAGLLQDDLQTRARTEMRDAPPDWKLALSLLVRASTLRPAIIAPSTRAASILRDFDLQDGCVQLYNYCSRIGVYGERIQGVFPGLFKLSSSRVPYSDQLSTLRSDIARWKESANTIPLKTQIASQLFQKAGWSLRAGTSQRNPEAAFDWMNWQMALRLGESMVSPVMEDRRHELARVKADVEDVSNKLSAPGTGEHRRQLCQPDIRAYLRQATTFAQRWISLHSGAATQESRNYLPQSAVELRSEIQNRHEPVMEELHTLASEQSSFEVRMAVACLMLSVKGIRDLVDPNISTDTREADPRHLLHAELLKISDLPLGSHWEPETDLLSLEEEILGFLSQPQPDWTTAFKMQLSRGNHQCGERILSLATWSNEERDALQGVLELDRHRQRTDFVRELNEVNTLLAESVHLDILNESERTGFVTRLSRLGKIVASEGSVSSGIIELDRVRQTLLKRREREADRIRNRLRQLNSSTPNDQESTSTPAKEMPPPSGWIMDFDQ